MFTHYVKHDVNVLAWSSCRCDAEWNHFVGEELHIPRSLPPTPIGLHMSDINAKRQAVASAYNSDSWRLKVKAMKDAQVVALFLKFRSEGKIR